MDSRRRLLLDALEHLASEPSAQQAYLTSLGIPDGVDELDLEFDDIAAARDDMLAMGELTPEEYREIDLLDGLLKRISAEAKARHWTSRALAANMEWTTIREQAQRCLHLIRQTGTE